MRVSIYILSVLCILFTFLPVWKNKNWFVRGQQYLKAFYLVISVFLILCFLCFLPFHLIHVGLILLLIGSALWSLKFIILFTPLGKKTVTSASKFKANRALKLYILNVYQDNDSYSRVLRQIEQVDPDIILLLETDRKWNRAMALLTDCYPFQESAIRNDTYGMMLMSRLEFEESSIHYRVLPDVPSVEALITVDATKIRLYGLHPKPPIPVEAFSSKSKDIELLKVANIIANRKNKEIALVIGDLNDVAWSRISMKMLDITGMVDPRKGRGFYSTFPVYSPFRIPLDHVFIEPQFELIDFRVMEDVGSDHFPVMIHLQLK